MAAAAYVLLWVLAMGSATLGAVPLAITACTLMLVLVFRHELHHVLSSKG